MNNSTQNNSALASAQKLILDDGSNTNKPSRLENIIISFICLIGLLYLGWVYYCWQRIPVKKHYIQATYLVSDNASNCNANITIIEPKTFFNADSLYWENNPKGVYS